ncbi:MAG: hypothetical protein QM778_14145 [Myxococcales bacterium]
MSKIRAVPIEGSEEFQLLKASARARVSAPPTNSRASVRCGNALAFVRAVSVRDTLAKAHGARREIRGSAGASAFGTRAERAVQALQVVPA